MNNWIKFVLVILLVVSAFLGSTTPSFAQDVSGELYIGDIHLSFSGHLTITWEDFAVSGNTIVGHVAEGAQGVIDLTATRSPYGPVCIRAVSLPAGWPAFSVASYMGTVTAQYTFTVPSDSAGERFELTFGAWTPGKVGEVQLIFILDVVAPQLPEIEVPEIEVSPTSLDFGEVPVGDKAELELTIKNIGEAELWIADVATEGDADSPFDLCGMVWTSYALAPGKEIKVKICFSPETTGSFNDTVLIDSDDPNNSELRVPVLGTAYEPQKIEVSPTPLDFGEVPVGGEGELDLTIKNIGGAELSIEDVTVEGGADSPFDFFGWTHYSLAPGESYNLSVFFSPTTTGSFSDTVLINSDDPTNLELKVPLQGSGIGPPKIEVSPASLDFGQARVRYDAPWRELTIKNIGETELRIKTVTIEGADASAFDSWHECTDHPLPPDESIKLTFEFAPEKAGTFNAQVLIKSNDPTRPEVTVSLHGTGAMPPAIERIIVTGIPSAKNPMTNDVKGEGKEKVNFEAIITDAPDFEVYKISWVSRDADFASGPLDTHNPYKATFGPRTYGNKVVCCQIDYKSKTTEELHTAVAMRAFKLFFPKDGDHDKDGIPNWFDYWRIFVPGLSQCRYNSNTEHFGYYDPNTGKVHIGERAAKKNWPVPLPPLGNIGGVGLGIDCCYQTVVHELKHKEVADNSKTGGIWRGKSDTDKDGLPDAWENTYTYNGHKFNPAKNDTYNISLVSPNFAGYGPIGDQEVLCRIEEQGKQVAAENDWACPGKQSDPVYDRSTEVCLARGSVDWSAKPILASEAASLGSSLEISSATEQAVDSDGDGKYDNLRVTIDSTSSETMSVQLIAELSDADEYKICMDRIYPDLIAGHQQLQLDFDGTEIRNSDKNGPYTLNACFYTIAHDAVLLDSKEITTRAYSSTDFQPQDAVFSGIYADQSTDTDADGVCDYLTVETEINVTVAGIYDVEGYLYGDSETAIAFAGNATHLDTGTQTVELNFKGLDIALSKTDGPYTLSYLILYDEDENAVDFAHQPYETSAYSHTDFEFVTILTGDYADYGTDTDGDGLFDYLTIDVGVMLAGEGHGVAAARIVDESGEEIAWTSNTALLSGGEPQIIQLDFDGLSINAHGVDGPYYLKDVYVNLYDTGDPALSDYVYDAYTTDVYEYTDFETVLTTALPNVKLISISADPAITAIHVSSLDLSEIDETYKPEGFTPKYAYIVDATGTGNFTLEFTDIADAGAIEVYKIDPTTTPPNEWVELDYATTGDTVTFTMSTGDPTVVFATPPEGGCFVATAAFGTPMAEEVEVLREYRDEYLLTNAVGKALVELYYRVSPPIAEFIAEHPSLRPIVRAGLVPAVAMSTVAVGTTPTERIAIIGLLALVSVVVAVWAKRQRGSGPEYTRG